MRKYAGKLKQRILKHKDEIGIIGQYTSMILLIIGLIVEVACKAHIGFITLTLGGLVWGVATKLRGK